MIKAVNNNLNNNTKNSNKIPFKGKGEFLTGACEAFIKSQENLSSTRFIQDTATNWLPKAVFSRSLADFSEMSFLEFTESAIFYFASPFLGEKLFRNIFKNFSPKNIRKDVNGQLANSLSEIAKNNSLTKEVKNRAIGTKAGIVLACTAIPVAEYVLSSAKNLFTLKTFKKSNFDDIANLDKEKTLGEDKTQQERVEKNAKKRFKTGAIISALGIAAGVGLALGANKSKTLLDVSKAVLEPGNAISDTLHKTKINPEKLNKADKFLKGLSLDFSSDNGKLALSKCQLGLTAIVGLFGYSAAARDRGERDVKEVWTRVPLVVLYTIFGSELFEKGFVKILNKFNKCQDVLKKGTDGALDTFKRSELDDIAKNIAKQKNTNVKDELNKLVKQKAFVGAVPYVFSIVFMGFLLSAITRLTTQKRYDKQKALNSPKTDNASCLQNALKNLPETFKAFKNSKESL